jgi:hypothetical protein
MKTEIEILAHRANLTGPEPQSENSVEACRKSLKEGFGLEIDLRRDASGRFYISHDKLPQAGDTALEAYLPLFQQHPHAPIAVNVKELGYEEALLELQKKGTFGTNDFYFDFELLEAQTPGRSQTLLASLPGGGGVRMASRLSDRNEPLAQCLASKASIVWADEFDSLWLTESEINAVRDSGRRIYLISPELHGFSREQRLARWSQFKSWNINGLCTDYVLEARDFFSK